MFFDFLATYSIVFCHLFKITSTNSNTSIQRNWQAYSSVPGHRDAITVFFTLHASHLLHQSFTHLHPILDVSSYWWYEYHFIRSIHSRLKIDDTIKNDFFAMWTIANQSRMVSKGIMLHVSSCHHWPSVIELSQQGKWNFNLCSRYWACLISSCPERGWKKRSE